VFAILTPQNNPHAKKWLRHYLTLPTHHPKKNSKIEIDRMKNRILTYTAEKKRISAWNATAYNGRFHASGAVTPQTILCKFARYYPAGTLVEAPPA